MIDFQHIGLGDVEHGPDCEMDILRDGGLFLCFSVKLGRADGNPDHTTMLPFANGPALRNPLPEAADQRCRWPLHGHQALIAEGKLVTRADRAQSELVGEGNPLTLRHVGDLFDKRPEFSAARITRGDLFYGKDFSHTISSVCLRRAERIGAGLVRATRWPGLLLDSTGNADANL